MLDAKNLQDAVTQALKQGWKRCGEPSVVTESDFTSIAAYQTDILKDWLEEADVDVDAL